MTMVPATFDRIAKSFGRVDALHPTSIDVAAGEFLTLLGPSGSGKTTLLNLCAGFLAPSEGRLLLAGRDVTNVPPRLRNMGMVFQNYALFPHMTVRENVGYGLAARRRPRAEVERRIAEALRLVQLDDFGDRSTRQLSGGQQQRVALARAIVIEPDVLLMDEPLGALDRQLRKEVQLEIRRLHVACPRTTLYVTHDQEEALVMSDRIAIMRAGRLVQIGSGRDLYENPATAFVARFLGDSNLIPGQVVSMDGETAALAVNGFPAPIVGRAAKGLSVGSAAVALLRPEAIAIGERGMGARVVERVYLGEITATRVSLAHGQALWCRAFGGPPSMSSDVFVDWLPSAARILPND